MEKFNLSELGKRIKAIRKEKKKTQEEIAAAIRISQKTISEWERGLIHPGILNMHNYCMFLGITLDELLDVKKPRTLLIELTEEERDTMLSMLDECQREACLR